MVFTSLQQGSDTVGVPPLERLKNDLLNMRAIVRRHIVEYQQRTAHTGRAPTGKIAAALFTFYLELEPALMRWLSQKEFDEIKKWIGSIDFNDLMKAYRKLNLLLDQKKIIRIDLDKAYDTTSVESENEVRHT